jgi:predicted amidophosphoribosyltransferase
MAEGSSSSAKALARRPGVRNWPQVGRRWFTGVSDALVSVFFPAGCRICDQLLTGASRMPICGVCLSSFSSVPGSACEICGQLPQAWIQSPGQHPLCQACQNETYAFDRARSFAVYEGALVQAILLLKLGQIEPLGACFAERLAQVVHGAGDLLAADVVVPVPLQPSP